MNKTRFFSFIPETTLMNRYFLGITATILLCITGSAFIASHQSGIPCLMQLLACAVTCIIITTYFLTQLNNKLEQQQEQILRLQINPHFLFNALNSIGDFVQQNDAVHADQYLSSFSKLMRSTLENSTKKQISLKEELCNLELYLKLEASRLRQNFTYEIQVEEDLSLDQIMVPPMILQPFIENSIWHAVSKVPDGKISIAVAQKGKQLEYRIYDNGPGYHPNNILTQKQKKSLGISISKERIRACYRGLFLPSGYFQYRNFARGIMFAIRIPLIK